MPEQIINNPLIVVILTAPPCGDATTQAESG
jgi:hypothetical protein